MGRDVIVLREDEIRAALDMPSCIEVVERALQAYSSGGASQPEVIHLEIPDRLGEIHIKAGYLRAGNVYAVKFASGFPGNAARRLPTSDGLVLAFDAETGAPRAFLFDNGFITDVRTGAAGGVAAKYLAPEKVETVAVIGTGAQARYQVEALAFVRSFAEVRVWGREEERARQTVDDLKGRGGLPEGCRTVVATGVQEAVEGAEVVLAVTASRQPVVLGDWLSPGCHVTAVGADGPGKRELDLKALMRADLLVADSRLQAAERGEFQYLKHERRRAGDGVVELGAIIHGLSRGRLSEDWITVCDLTGVGVQDVAAAALVLERAAAAGAGETITI